MIKVSFQNSGMILEQCFHFPFPSQAWFDLRSQHRGQTVRRQRAAMHQGEVWKTRLLSLSPPVTSVLKEVQQVPQHALKKNSLVKCPSSLQTVN